MTTKRKILIAIFLVSLGVFGRLLPHLWNFAPIIAIGLFAGAYLGKNWAFITPVLSMVLSDLFIGFYDWKINLSVYIAIALSGLIGLLLQKRKNILTLTLASISSSTLFFLITNAAVWYFGTMYSPKVEGLFASLNAGIPFFRSALRGDLWYSLLLFGTYELVMLYIPQIKTGLSKNFASAYKSLIS